MGGTAPVASSLTAPMVTAIVFIAFDYVCMEKPRKICDQSKGHVTKVIRATRSRYSGCEEQNLRLMMNAVRNGIYF